MFNKLLPIEINTDSYCCIQMHCLLHFVNDVRNGIVDETVLGKNPRGSNADLELFLWLIGNEQTRQLMERGYRRK